MVFDYLFLTSFSPPFSFVLNQFNSLTKDARNSFRGILRNLPSLANDIVPVSSDTTTVKESVISLIPRAARCLAPYNGLSS